MKEKVRIQDRSERKRVECENWIQLPVEGGARMAFDYKKEYKEFYMPKNKPETVARMDRFLEENGYENDFSEERLHHEIYLSDARRVAVL